MKRTDSLRKQQHHQPFTRGEQWAAVVLQKYFRMWLAQARMTRMQMASQSHDTERIVFAEQVGVRSMDIV